ncbi:MAG: 2-C-methyl-D-erythritol 4-phosphate cytidylyltransferase [Micropruina glycogenica]
MNVALIFAGGIGSMTVALPKQFLRINGKPVIIHTLEHFENHPDIDAIASRPLIGGWHDHCAPCCTATTFAKVRWIIEEWRDRPGLSAQGARAVANECADSSVVLLHDGVRPLINHQLITENIRPCARLGDHLHQVPTRPSPWCMTMRLPK